MATARPESCVSKDSANLDVLRSVAVMYVFGFHLFAFFGYTHIWRLSILELGFLGVLFFFVHTSFVLMCSLERQESRSPGRPLWNVFLLRRVFRIYPLSIAIVTFVLVFSLPVGHLRNRLNVAAHLDHFGVLLNYLLAQDFFGRESIMATLWSLPLEMHMYLLLPMLYVLTNFRRSVWLVGLLWGAAVVVAMHPYRLTPIGLGTFSQYVPCFLPGILAYTLSTKRHFRFPSFFWPIFLATMTVLYLSHSTLMSGWVCCLVLGLAVPQFLEVSNPACKKICLIIARYSYGIYVTHVICIWFAFQKLAGLPRYTQWIVFVAAAVASPVILYHALESPMIKLGNRVASRFRSQKPVPLASVEATAQISSAQNPGI
jgi:peptidoglycan/LPS O-acetylase OafA/YrhL